jgi:hypothetical protein
MERDILLKNLKSVLESLRGQVTGKTKDEIEESISMVGFFIFFCQFIGLTFPAFPLTPTHAHPHTPGGRCSGESCRTESLGHGFEAASPHLREKTCLGLSLPQTPLMWSLQHWVCPFFLSRNFQQRAEVVLLFYFDI